MKKISILLAAILLVAFLMCGTVVYADETGEETPAETDTPADDETEDNETEEETVEVPKDVWEEILETLDKLKDAQSSDEIQDIVENTWGARIREYFGESWGNIVLAAVFIVVSIVFTIINKKGTSTLLAGVGTVYKTAKSTAEKISKKEGITLDEIIELAAGKSDNAATKAEKAEKMAKATAEMVRLLVMNSNAKEVVKVEAEKLYQGAVGDKEV